jgi:RNA polymerase sigma-70 factor (ECF subfamily)
VARSAGSGRSGRSGEGGGRGAGEGDLAGLIGRVASGDRAALRAIYVRQSGRLFGLAAAVLRDRTAAADAFQDGFLRIWQRARLFDADVMPAEVWLAGEVHAAALELARLRGREVPSDDATLADTAIDPDALDGLAASDGGRRLRDGLMRLAPELRRAVVAGFVHGMSPAELAPRIDRPVAGLRPWLRRGLLALRDAMA